MSNFDSLCLAFEDWFDKPLADLPEALRQRVEQEFSPMPWDQLSPAGRRSVALQLDYQHDPATAEERRLWWDFYQRVDAVKDQIAKWEAVAAPTAADLALKETRLAELNQELTRMKIQERTSVGEYRPEQKHVDVQDGGSAASPAPPIRYIAYPKAMNRLTTRLNATPEELAAWLFMGPEDGGIAAYLNANELDPPPRFRYATGSDSQDYVAPLMACWFKSNELDQFEPADRYITGKTLIERWSAVPNLDPAAFIRAKIAESRLTDMHPIYGGTQGGFSDESDYPPLASGLFALSQIENVEAADFAEVAESGDTSTTLVQPPDADEASVPGDATKGEPVGPCAAFLAMVNLVASELSLAFVGDRAESGLRANNMLEISARGTTKRVALAALDLVDSRRGTLNSQCAILLGLVQKRKLPWSGDNAAKMTRLRRVFKKHLGVDDPFHPFHHSSGWVARFEVVDRRGAADERAKQDAERRTVSYEQLTESGAQFAEPDPTSQPLDPENDAAAEWLKGNDPDARA